jgi:hypothetical protein
MVNSSINLDQIKYFVDMKSKPGIRFLRLSCLGCRFRLRTFCRICGCSFFISSNCMKNKNEKGKNYKDAIFASVHW